MVRNLSKEAGLDLSKLSARERLVGEQAVFTLRALDQAADEAAEGEGLNRLEAVIHDQGCAHLRQMMGRAIEARDEAQKKGPASATAGVAGVRRSRRATAAWS
jgi:hypothetical protein